MSTMLRVSHSREKVPGHVLDRSENRPISYSMDADILIVDVVLSQTGYRLINNQQVPECGISIVYGNCANS